MRIRIKFSKYGPVRFIGHLDVMRYFQKAIRRAKIDIAYSEGFSPHQKMSFAAPLSVGHTSNGEYFDIEVNHLDSIEQMKNALQKEMVDGIDILDAAFLPEDAGNAMASVAAASYYITMDEQVSLPENFYEALLEFYDQPEIMVVKETKRGHREVNLKDSIYELDIREDTLGAAKEPSRQRIYMKLNASSGGNIKPSFVLECFCKTINYELPPFCFRVHRIETYQEMGGKLQPLLWEK